MRDFPPDIYERLIHILLLCDVFDSDAALRTFFIYSDLYTWRNELPLYTNTKRERVEQLVDFLHDQYNDQGQNALILFLHVLADHTNPADALHLTLSET